jgi:hypothetical protein
MLSCLLIGSRRDNSLSFKQQNFGSSRQSAQEDLQVFPFINRNLDLLSKPLGINGQSVLSDPLDIDNLSISIYYVSNPLKAGRNALLPFPSDSHINTQAKEPLSWAQFNETDKELVSGGGKRISTLYIMLSSSGTVILLSVTMNTKTLLSFIYLLLLFGRWK